MYICIEREREIEICIDIIININLISIIIIIIIIVCYIISYYIILRPCRPPACRRGWSA